MRAGRGRGAWKADSRRKDDRIDARPLARLARIDPQFLSPVQHRSAKAQRHLTVVRARAILMEEWGGVAGPLYEVGGTLYMAEGLE
jgi:hypothetical protein